MYLSFYDKILSYVIHLNTLYSNNIPRGKRHSVGAESTIISEQKSHYTLSKKKIKYKQKENSLRASISPF